MNRRILFLSKGGDSPSSRYRAFNYFDTLKHAGWDPAHLSFHAGPVGKVLILLAALRADVVVILRHGFSFPFLQLLSLCSRKIVFDFDDAVFVKSNGEYSPTRSKRFDNTVRRCDQVWAGNYYLAKRAQQVNNNVTIIPTAVDLNRYVRAIGNGNTSKPEDTIDLVWIGSSSTAKYLEAILPCLERAAVKVPRLRLKIIADFALRSKVLNIIAIPWSEKTEIQELHSSHIGIAPMPDTPWTRGKCALKVLQYMACGLPVISSNVGVNSEIIEPLSNGLLAANDEEWIEHIVALSSSAPQREKMGAQGREDCENSFSLAACSQLMLEQLQDL